MIWIDFGIICIGQEKKSVPPNTDNLVIEAYQRTANAEQFYNENYNFHTADKQVGIWYNIWLSEPICYDESLFDISSEQIPNVCVVPKYEALVKQLLEFYLDESPEHNIAVLLRVEDKSNDTVHSLCTLDDFIQALKAGKVKWNELYFIRP